MSLGAYNVLTQPLVSPFESTSSMSFDGTDDVITTSADSTLATKTYSFYAKSTDTGANSVFDHGGGFTGALQFHYGGGSNHILWMNGGYVYWPKTSDTSDGTWHHHVFVLSTVLADCKWYLDGVFQSQLLNTTHGASSTSYTTGIRIGRNGSAYFDGLLDSFAIFNGDQSALADELYNNGRPGSLLRHSTLDHHYRMGEGVFIGGKRDGDDSLLFDQSTNGGLGSELLTNGTFDTDSDWSHSGTTISGGTANFSVSSGGYIFMSQSESYVDGSRYQLTATVNGTSGKVMRFMDSGANNGGLTTTNGVITMTGAAQEVSITFTANANSSTILIGRHTSSGDYSFTVDNVSLKELPNLGTISGATFIPAEGAELLTGFTNGSSYPFNTFTSSGRDITAAIETSGDFAGGASNQFSIVDETTYKVTFNLTYNSGSDTLRVVLADNANGAATLRSNAYYTTTNGVNVAYLTATATDSTAHLQIGTWHESDLINFSATNITLQEVTNGVPLQCKGLKPVSRGEKALSFDGSDDVVEVSSLSTFSGASQFTLSGWFKKANTGHGLAISYDNSSNVRTSMNYHTDSNVYFSVATAGANYGAFSLASTDWVHLAMVYNGNASGNAARLKGYLNGVEQTLTFNSTIPATAHSQSAIFRIGKDQGHGLFSEGVISDVAVWDVPLDSTAVKALYNAGQPTHLTCNTGAYTYKDNLKAFFKMGNGQQKNAVVDGESNLLFDQANRELGSELFKSGSELYASNRWFGADQTFTENSARFVNPGDAPNGAFTRLRSTGGQAALLSTPAAGTHLLFECDFLTDDANAEMLLFNEGAYNNLGSGSGHKSLYFTSDGTDNNFVWFQNIDIGNFVEVSNLTLKEVTAGTITSATIVTGNVPTPT